MKKKRIKPFLFAMVEKQGCQKNNATAGPRHLPLFQPLSYQYRALFFFSLIFFSFFLFVFLLTLSFHFMTVESKEGEPLSCRRLHGYPAPQLAQG